MYWLKFEKELKLAYAIIDCKAQRIMHDNGDKLYALLNKHIQADFLKTMVSVLKIQLGTVPLKLTLEGAMNSICNKADNYNNTLTGAKF